MTSQPSEITPSEITQTNSTNLILPVGSNLLKLPSILEFPAQNSEEEVETVVNILKYAGVNEVVINDVISKLKSDKEFVMHVSTALNAYKTSGAASLSNVSAPASEATGYQNAHTPMHHTHHNSMQSPESAFASSIDMHCTTPRTANMNIFCCLCKFPSS